jgi:hypothetical protein
MIIDERNELERQIHKATLRDSTKIYKTITSPLERHAYTWFPASATQPVALALVIEDRCAIQYGDDKTTR